MYITGNPIVDLNPMQSNLAVALNGTIRIIDSLPLMWLLPKPPKPNMQPLINVPMIVPAFYLAYMSQT